MISERLLRARDLVSRYEYETVDGRRHIKARVCSSTSLGLEEHEEFKAARTETDSAAHDAPSGAQKGRWKGRGLADARAPDEDHEGKE
ncbi:MAG TPA: hypothetical protein PLB91_01220 [Spirochaetales bacterium]|nr:hypothetical protein [Spirochaetales bacterium]HRY54301.1 hypothetical protein [Spirochaetia bacterium]